MLAIYRQPVRIRLRYRGISNEYYGLFDPGRRRAGRPLVSCRTAGESLRISGESLPKSSYPSESAYNRALLDECQAQGIGIIAITDHWCAVSAKGLISDAEARGIVALPGFEANTSEGIHLLVIFERGTKLDDITLAIGACGLTPGDPHAVADKRFSEIVDTMTQRGALVIPAHVNVANSGLLARIKGKPLEPMIKHPGILALGVTPSCAPIGDQEKILQNKAPYKRKHPLVEIFADDIMGPSGLASEGGSSWFKMCEPSLAGLCHAIRTPQTRVSTSDPATTSRVLLREISWTGGFLDGQSIPLAEDLTALIGGRGTGKSTAIESLRYVLDLPPIGESARSDHEGVVKNVLRTATTTSLVVDVISPEPARYTIERTVPDPPVVKDSSGTATSLKPRDVVGTLEIFGQHELAELAQDKTLMAQMVGRIAGNPVAAMKRPELLEKLAENRRAFVSLEQSEANLEADLADIPRLEERSRKFKESDLGVKLAQNTVLRSEEGVFSEAQDRVVRAEEAIAEVDLAALHARLKAPLTDIEGGPREALLVPARDALQAAARSVEAAEQSLMAALATAKAAIGGAKAIWEGEVKPIQETNAEVFRQLISDGYNPDEFIATTTQLDRLTKKSEQRVTLSTRRTKLESEREALMLKLAENDQEIAEELIDAVKRANAATSKAVVVRPTADPDRSKIKAVVDTYFKTPRTQIFAAIEADGFSTRAFVAAARSGEEALKRYGLTGAQMRNFLAHGEPMFRELEEQSVGRAVEVQLNIAPKGSGTELRSLEDLSKGQRATALLLMLLGVSGSPLVIDQPEDDLDNRFIYRGVVTRLRELKGSRQIVVSTHNANVPVLGDAELVVALEGDGRNGWVAPGGLGSLDTLTVREYAEDLLEGGHDAFSARQHLYGF